MIEKIHIVMAADEAYRKGLEVARTSMIESCSDPSQLQIHVFDGDSDLEVRIRNDFGTYKGSPMAFLRLYLGELLPDVEWVIYSDVDTLWRRDVLELAALFDDKKTIQWVRDLPGTVAEFTGWCRQNNVPLQDCALENYSCSGICIINLKRWRENNVLGRCREFVKKFGYPKYADQDILNAILSGEAGLLPGCWDVLIPHPDYYPHCVLHITGVGRCFSKPYTGNVVQFRYWESIARGNQFKRPWSLPFYLNDWMIRLCLPLADVFLRDRIRRHFAWRWYLRKIIKVDHND